MGEYVKPDVYISPDEKAIEDLVNRNLDLIGGLTDDIRDKMIDILKQGMSEGWGINQIIDAMEEAGVAYGYAAERIARTEIMKSLTEGEITQYKEDGAEKVQWLAGPDDRACDECMEYHLRVYPIDDVPDMPVHPNCRCDLVPYFDDLDPTHEAEKDREKFEKDLESGDAPYGKNDWSEEDLDKWKKAGDKFKNKGLSTPDSPVLITIGRNEKTGENIPRVRS